MEENTEQEQENNDENTEQEEYNEVNSKNLTLYISERTLEGYNKTTVTIDGREYSAYEVNDRFVIVYAMNIANEEYNYYKYDKIDGTFQFFDVNEIKREPEKDNKGYAIAIVILSVMLVGLIVTYVIHIRYKCKK